MAASGASSPALSGGPVARFVTGFGYLLSGAGFLVGRPRLWPYAAVPVLLTLALVVVAVPLGWRLGDGLLERIWVRPEGWLVALWWVVDLLARLVAMLVAVIGAWWAGSLVAIPFNELLSERVERLVMGDEGEPFVLRVFIADVLQSAGHTLLGLALWVAISVPLLLLHLLPGVGTLLATVVGTAVTAFFMARELLDHPLARKRLSFGEKLAIQRRDFWLFEGFGAAAVLVLAFPVVNLLVFPLTVVGGTLLYCDLVKAGRLPEVRRG